MVQSLKYCLKSKLFWVYVALATLAFFKQLLSESLLIDSLEYTKKASFLFENWIASNIEIDRFLEPMRRTVGYPLIIKSLFFNHYAIYLLQTLISLCVPIVLHKFCEKYKYHQNIWSVSMLLLLTYPSQFFYGAFLMPDILCQFLLLLLFFTYFEGHWRAFPLILTGLILLKPVFLVFLIFPIILFLLKRYKLSLFDIIPIFVVCILSIVNYKQYKIFTYSSVGTTNAYDYNRKILLLLQYNETEIERMYDIENAELNQLSGNFEAQKSYMDGKTIPVLLKLKYWFIHFRGMAVTFIDPGRYDAMVFLNWNKSIGFMGVNDGNVKKALPWWQMVYMGIFVVFMIFKFVFAVYATFQWRRHQLVLFFAIVILFLAFIAGPVGCARYLLPVYPLMAFLSALGFLTFLKNNSKIESFITQR